MSEWSKTILRNHIDKVVDNRGKNPPYMESGYPVIETGCISGNNKFPNLSLVKKYVDQETYDSWFRSGHPEQGDLLIITVGNGIGSCAIYKNGNGCITQNLIGIRPIKEELSSEFLYYYLSQNELYDFLQSLNIGSAQPSLKVPHILGLEIPYPPLPEQKAIASVLSSLDDKIDLLHRQNKTLEAMAETLFRQWFIEEAKEEWEETTLEHHIVAIKGLSYKGSGLCDVGQGIPMFNLNSVLEGGGYKTTGLKYYKGDYKERHLVKADDIIVANTEQGHEHRLIGFPAVIPSYFNGENIFTHHIFKVSLLESTYLTNQFIYYLLCSSAVREQITGATNGSTVNQLAADGLQRPRFRLPPKNLVQNFTNQVISFWKKKDLNQQQIWSLEKLRDTLLPKLMSGEVRVQFQTEEVA